MLIQPAGPDIIEHMFESVRVPAGGASVPTTTVSCATVPTAGVDSGSVAAFITALIGLDRGVDDAERVTQLELLERLKSAAAAAQAVVSTDFAASQRAAQRVAGVPAARRPGSGKVSPPRSGWPGGTRPSAVDVTSGWPRR